MKKLIYLASILFFGAALSFTSCKKTEEADTPPVVEVGESTTDLLVKKFSQAPSLDGTVDAMWATAQPLIGACEVPQLSARGTYLNSDGEGTEEELGLFAPYNGEKYDFKLRSGYVGDEIHFLLEWQDDKDSKDRQSWYFDASTKLWKGEHKYANASDDKFYEDKFSFLFPIGEVAGFESGSCYATCHMNLDIVNAKDKHTRHYLTVDGQKMDMWHWKRVRGTYYGQVDDQKMVYADASLASAANGRKGDATGEGGYSNNSQTLNNGNADVSVPKYIIPNQTDYYWISRDDIDNGIAKLITAVDANGVLSYDGGTIDPSEGGFEQGTGNSRIPSVTTKPFTLGRGDIEIMAVHTGSGWVCEFKRKMNTEDEDDVVFNVDNNLPFGLAIFNNAAIAHGIKTNLVMKFEK